ncbi:MAG TPA: ATP-binding protein [Acidimicrobiales bacterium]
MRDDAGRKPGEAGESLFDRDRLRAEARLVGLRQFRTPTLEAVERRRIQLWLLSIVILLGISAIVTAGSIFPDWFEDVGVERSWFAGSQFRILMLTLTLGFSGYVYEKERSLRRLTRLLVDERVLTAALSNRLAEVSALLEAGKAINSVLELDAVLHIILNSATSLLQASGGSIMLAAPEREELHAVCVHGNDAALGATVSYDENISGRVARSWEPLLITGNLGGRQKPVESALCVPLLHRSQFLGVLNLNGGKDRTFSEYDLRALSLFAEQAAAAIANARLYEIERQHVAELVESEMRKSEFLAAVSHDLKTPLTSLIGCTKMLQRDGLTDSQRLELASMVDRQALRLSSMIDDLLTAARLEAEKPPVADPVDLAALIRELATEYHVAGRPFTATVPATVVVLAQADGLRRILTNLLDNAFKHGGAPVTVAITTDDDHVEVEVRDHGPGIPADDRERVFERFTRLDVNRQIPGIGLGLSIVQGLVVAYGGEVRADAPADDGAGTVMRVRLRAA